MKQALIRVTYLACAIFCAVLVYQSLLREQSIAQTQQRFRRRDILPLDRFTGGHTKGA